MDVPGKLHPTDQTLRSYGLGKLDDARTEEVFQHLGQCPACRERVAELTTDSFLSRVQKARGTPSKPTMSYPESSEGGLDAVPAHRVLAPPAPGTIPAGLAGHPDYEVRSELGRGGMGVVYLAQNRFMGRLEVLKVVSSHLANRRGVLDRFVAEIRNAARLHHPNIVTAYSASRIGESLVLAMEYVEGLDLSRMVKARGPLPVATACNYVHQAALGLQHAHECGMVHRDIKPSNLMLTREGNRALVKVLDFGLAKVQGEGSADGGLTHDGQMLGTPDYIAPEQISGARRADIRADIYSLGCTLYHLLTGSPPFEAESLYDILQAHHSMDAMPLNLKRPEVPVELAALVARMMAKEPKRRFQTPKEVAQALTPFFKKGGLAFKSPVALVSQAGRAVSNRSIPGVDSPPTEPATNNTRPAVQSKEAAAASRATQWKSPIDVQPTQHPSDPAPAVDREQRPARNKWPISIAVSLFGLIGFGAIIIAIRDREGRGINKTTLASADPLKVGTSWRGTSTTLLRSWAKTKSVHEIRPLWLTIKDRSYTEFNAMAESCRGSHEAEGRFQNGIIEWKVAKEHSSWQGKLEGSELAGTFEGNSPAGHFSGEFRLHLAEGLPPNALPGRVPKAGPLRCANNVRATGWTVEGEQVVKEGVHTGGVTFGDQEWADYELTFEACKIAGRGGLGAHFRETDC